MDQSKEPAYPDQVIRTTALQMALQVNMTPNGFPDEAIRQARQFYLFLTGRDPVIDTGLSKTPVEEFEDDPFESSMHEYMKFLEQEHPEELKQESHVIYLDDHRDLMNTLVYEGKDPLDCA